MEQKGVIGKHHIGTEDNRENGSSEFLFIPKNAKCP